MAKNNLHPGARWLFRFRIIWIIIFITIFLGFISSSFIIRFLTKTGLFSSILIGWLVMFLILLAIGEIWVRLYYNGWLFEFDKNNLRLERGVIWKRYSNVPYDRIQNVDIHRGILARLLGFSSIYVQTAGYSSYGRYGLRKAEGYIPAVSVKSGEKIRDFLMKKIKKGSKGL